ncbi:hypothetical protein GCM10010383_62640 [Streptomyces lomondensis]|uniref:HTH gntR-type domain-containing protein n=1 Tax=Streptomyces lomondensis TaxID=68229 RepID=A0ABQ2XML3_9ACTN|nr:hypothetical protein GCM10010383_62640 [Streptomyces lomondensis]
MSQQASPRGPFLMIADALKARIAADPDMTELPSLAEVMRDHKVSRGLALRAFGVLRQEVWPNRHRVRMVARRAFGYSNRPASARSAHRRHHHG